MDKIKARKRQKLKNKLLYVKVFETSTSNQYLKCFNPFVPADKEYDVPNASLFSEKKYNKFFEISGSLPRNIIDKYWRINNLIQFFLNEFYYIYDSKPYYNRKFLSAEALFRFILKTVYSELSSKTENFPLNDYFGYERDYIDYFYIKDFIDVAKERFLEKRRCIQLKRIYELRPDPKSSAKIENINNFAKEVYNLLLVKNKHKAGIYCDELSSFIIEDNLVYCCFAFILIDILLEDKYENTNTFFDLIDIQQKLILGLDNNILQKEVENRISEQNSKKCRKAGKASGAARREAKNKGYELWKRENLFNYKTENALSYYSDLIKEYNLGEDTVKKSWFRDYRKWDKNQSNNVQ